MLSMTMIEQVLLYSFAVIIAVKTIRIIIIIIIIIASMKKKVEVVYKNLKITFGWLELRNGERLIVTSWNLKDSTCTLEYAFSCMCHQDRTLIRVKSLPTRVVLSVISGQQTYCRGNKNYGWVWIYIYKDLRY